MGYLGLFLDIEETLSSLGVIGNNQRQNLKEREKKLKERMERMIVEGLKKTLDHDMQSLIWLINKEHNPKYNGNEAHSLIWDWTITGKNAKITHWSDGSRDALGVIRVAFVVNQYRYPKNTNHINQQLARILKRKKIREKMKEMVFEKGAFKARIRLSFGRKVRTRIHFDLHC
jgi:hypothetical protein